MQILSPPANYSISLNYPACINESNVLFEITFGTTNTPINKFSLHSKWKWWSGNEWIQLNGFYWNHSIRNEIQSFRIESLESKLLHEQLNQLTIELEVDDNITKDKRNYDDTTVYDNWGITTDSI